MFLVYILQGLKDKRLYVGMTADINRRFEEHRQGKVKSTKSRRPFKLVCYEAYLTKKEAANRERFLESSDGKKDISKRLTESLEKK